MQNDLAKPDEPSILKQVVRQIISSRNNDSVVSVNKVHPVSLPLLCGEAMFSCGSSNSSESVLSGTLKCHRADNEPEQKPTWEILSQSPTECCLSLPSLVLSVLVHSAGTTRGQNLSAFPVSKSGCTVALFTILPLRFFLFLFPPFSLLATAGIN